MNIHNILDNWDIGENLSVTEAGKTAWLVGSSFVLKTGSKEEWLKNNIRIAKTLHTVGLAVPHVLKTRTGDDYILEDGAYYCMFTRLPGEHIADHFEGDYLNRAHLLGTILAQLHVAFQKVETQITCKDNDLCSELTGWVAERIEKGKTAEQDARQVREFAEDFRALYQKLPRQVIHRDVHAGNLLFQDGKLSGYIDFDLSKKDARLFDLCYFGLGVLSGCFADAEKREKWVQMFSEMAGGYDSVCQLTAEEWEAIPQMCYAIELIFIAYFSKSETVNECQLACVMADWIHGNADRLKSLKRKSELEEMKAFFDKRASGYEQHMTECFGVSSYEKGISAIQPSDEALRVLDIGCGTGLELEYLFKILPNARVTCLDLSENMLAVLKENYKERSDQLEILQGSYLEWQFPADTYDIVIAFNTMHHFTKEVKTEIYRNIFSSLKEERMYVEADFILDEGMEQQYMQRYERLKESIKSGYYHIDIPFSLEQETALLQIAAFADVRVFHADIKREGSFAVITAKK